MALLYDDEGDEQVPSFGINKEFAQKFETKKRTEELSKRKSSQSPLSLQLN